MSVSSEEVGTELWISSLETELAASPPETLHWRVKTSLVLIANILSLWLCIGLEKAVGFAERIIICDCNKSLKSVFTFLKFSFQSSIIKYYRICRSMCLFTNMLYTMSDYASEVGRQRSISYPEYSQTKQHAFLTMPVGRLDMYLLWVLLASICLKLFFNDAGKLKNYRDPFQELLSPLGNF